MTKIKNVMTAKINHLIFFGLLLIPPQPVFQLFVPDMLFSFINTLCTLFLRRQFKDIKKPSAAAWFFHLSLPS
ncbi:MAG: hypothetical protein JNJ93_03150 [Acinetobacter sp.]|nr:hypothetical protein [Acinetobacter sp.]